MNRFPLLCLLYALVVLIWSAIHPHDYPTWVMEVLPALIAGPLLIATHKKFPLTNLLYGLIALHASILMVGGHYTYAHVPLFDWIRDVTSGTRNSFDGLGHFAQGFVPAMAARELLIRTSPLRPGRWMFVIIVLSCLGISAIYELIEWQAAVAIGSGADEFLGTQGDPWDTQKDMALAGIGAIVALLTLSRIHDRALAKLN